MRHLNTALEYLSEETDGGLEGEETSKEHREALLGLRKKGLYFLLLLLSSVVFLPVPALVHSISGPTSSYGKSEKPEPF